MRKETWFRGPLLSVLFFSLFWGGAPTIAADLPNAEGLHRATAAHMSPGACADTGGRWVGTNNPNGQGSWEQNNPGNPNGYCQSASEYCAELEDSFPALGWGTAVAFGANSWAGWGMVVVSFFNVWDYYAYDC
ncbi:MAG: hypothetical protein OXH70_11085 [Acidobacteria bacterium]|nr:hypothetical protein [Acidobacteriota bacterium]